jgi:antitoxin FitA
MKLASARGLCLAYFLVPHLNDGVKARLQSYAARHGRSMEEEGREILRDALKVEDVQAGGLGTEIASLFSGVGLNAEIPELRGLVHPHRGSVERVSLKN